MNDKGKYGYVVVLLFNDLRTVFIGGAQGHLLSVLFSLHSATNKIKTGRPDIISYTEKSKDEKDDYMKMCDKH